MKPFWMALLVAVFLAGQFFTPAAAENETSTDCGSTYTVVHGDYLAKIARYCGTTVNSILALNPQITNPSLIYAGQTLNLSGTASVPVTSPWGYGTGGPYTGWYAGSAWVSLSDTQAAAGDTITVYAHAFPADTDIDFRISEQGEDYSAIWDGKTDSSGSASATITIPSAAASGEYWVVHVITTNGLKGSQAYSPKIYITG